MMAGFSLSRIPWSGFAVLASLPLLFGSCDQGPVEVEGSASAPVSFRLQGARGAQLPATAIVQIRAWVDDTIPLDSQRFDWTSQRAELSVPLDRPLRFQLDGIIRKAGRDVVVWSATGTDTLREARRDRAVVTLQWTTLDTTAPDARSFQASAGADVSVDTSQGTLSIVLPAGIPRTVLSLDASAIESLYVAGQPVTAVDGVFVVEVARGDARSILLVGKNRAATELSLLVRSGDVVGPSFVFSADNAARKSLDGDTTVFSLPYVVASRPQLLVERADPADAIRSISFDGVKLDSALPAWTIAVDVPPATPDGARRLQLVAKDSLGNPSARWIRVRREPSTRSPSLEWIDPPGPEPLGARTASLVLRISGGDSLLEPEFAVEGLNDPAVTLLQAIGDTSWWQCSIALLARDSGRITASVANRCDSTWSLDPAGITRFDPQGADVTAPTLAITSPPGASAWVLTGGTTRIEGRAFDERGGKVDVRVRIGQRTASASWSASDSSWSYVLAWSGDGDTTLVVQALDSIGNPSAEQSVRLRRDTRAPALAWSVEERSSGDTVFCEGATLRLELAVKDTGGGVKDVAILRQSPEDSVVAQADPARADVRIAVLDLIGVQGRSPRILVATDSAGNRSTRSLVVFRDTIAPRIVRQQPVANPDTVAAGSAVSVTYQVADSLGVDSLYIDGQNVAVDAAGIYTRQLVAPAAGSSRRVRVEAMDRLGNRTVDSSLRLVGLVRAPVQTRGVAPGTTAREFFFDAACPDAGATLQTYTGSAWAAWTASRFVANTLSLRTRCAIGAVTSAESVFSWTIVDGSVELPAGLAAVGDSAWNMATDSAGTLWIVTSKSKAWFWPKGDSAWHTTTSPFTLGGVVEFGAGRAADGAIWVLTQNGSDYAIAAVKDTTITPVTQGRFAPAFQAGGPIRMAVGRLTFALAYRINGTSMTVQYGTNLSPQTLRSYPVVGSPVLNVAGIIPLGNGSFKVLLHVGTGDSVGVVSVPSDFAYDPRSMPRPTPIQARYQPRYIALLDDGNLLIGTSSVLYGFRGPYGGAGMIYRFSTASVDAPIDSLPLPGYTPGWTTSPGSSRVWIGNGIVANVPPAEPIQVFPTAPLGARFALTPHTSDGCTRIVSTSWGSAWAWMSAEGLMPKLYRYHPR